MYSPKKYESGIAMLEVAIITATLVLITGLVLWVVSIFQTNQKIDQAKREIADIAMTVQALSLKHKDFSNLDGISDVNVGKEFLEKLHVTTKTPFGGASYYAVVYDPNFPDVFSIYIAGLDHKYCKKLNGNAFRGAIGGGCGETYANSRFVKSQQNMGVAVAINPDTGIARGENRFGIFYKKIGNAI